MKYIAPECEIYLVETQDVITASAEVETSDEKTDVFAGADDILNQILYK